MPDYKSFLDYLSTPGGAALVNAAGGGLQAYGQNQQQNQQQKQSAAQFGATTAQNQFNADRSAQMQQASGVLGADPLGANQQFAQKNALSAAILPNLRNFQSHPADSAVANAMGGNRGGFMNALPQGGLDPKMIDSMFGPDATMSSITQHQKELNSLSPSAPQMNLAPMYGQQASAGPQADIKAWADKLQSADANSRAGLETQLDGYVKQMLQQEQASGNTSGFWHKFAKIAAIVGAGAATIMTAGGASPLLIAAVGAGAGAAGSWGNGGSPLMGAITGGVTSGLGSQLANGAIKTATDLRVNH